MKKVFVSMAAIALLATQSVAFATIIQSNNIAGDSFTNSNNSGSDLSQAVGTSGWIYSNVRYGATIGINSNYAHGSSTDNNGSVFFKGTIGPSDPSGKTSKADIEFWNTTTGLGKLSNLSAFSYDWYRKSGGTAGVDLHPMLRLYVANETRTKMGYLVFELAYNKDRLTAPAATNTWVTNDVLGGDYRMWSTGSLPDVGLTATSKRLSQWQSTYGTYDVMGVSSGIGSGWGSFEGAVDNITFGFGTNTTYNFEVTPAAVPEPGSMAVLLSGIVGVGAFAIRRRRD